MSGSLIVLQFSGVSDERPLTELVPAERLAGALTADPLREQFDTAVALPDQAQRIAQRCGHPVGAVIGACSAAALALQLAAHLAAAWGRAPRAVLIDPFRVRASHVHEEFESLVAKLDADTGASGDPVPGPPQVLTAGVMDAYESALLRRREGLVAACGGEDATDVAMYLLLRYRAWLRFFAAAALAAPIPHLGAISVLSARPDELAGDLAGLLENPGEVTVRGYDAEAARGSARALDTRLGEILAEEDRVPRERVPRGRVPLE